MVIGLTGPNASGKGEAASYIKSKGYSYYSLSDILREESKMLGIEPSRENLIKLGNDLRQEKGESYLALRIIQKLQQKENYVIDSIRNLAEIEAFKKRGSFLLIGIDAPQEIRFKRSQKRKRSGDAKSYQDFIKKEEKENTRYSCNQQLKSCLSMADTIIINDCTIEELHKKIDEALKNN